MIWKNSIETCILSSVKKIASPGWMHELSAQGWCTGMTQRDGMGREVGGGSGWGTHVNPWLIHVSVWQKPLQYCKVINLQLIKIIGGKNIQKELWEMVNEINKSWESQVWFKMTTDKQQIALEYSISLRNLRKYFIQM